MYRRFRRSSCKPEEYIVRLRDGDVYHKKYAYGTNVVNRFSPTHTAVNGKNERRVIE